MHRLGEERKLRSRTRRAAIDARPRVRTSDKRRGGDAVAREDLLRPRLVEAERERERVAARVGNAEELADRGDVRLAIRAVQAFGDVEDDVGARGAEPLGKVFVRLEADRRRRARRARVATASIVSAESHSANSSSGAGAIGATSAARPVAATGRLFVGARQLAAASAAARAQAFGCTRTRCASSRPYCGIPLRGRVPLSADAQAGKSPRALEKCGEDYGTRDFSRNRENCAAQRKFRCATRSDFVVRDPRRLAAILRLIDLEVGEESRRFLLRAGAAPRPRSRRISSSAPSLERSSSIVRQARAFPVTTIFVSVAFGRTPRAASRAIFRRWTLSRHPAVALHQLLHERDVRCLRALDLRAPRALERLVADDRRRHDEARLATRPRTAARAASTRNPRDGEPARASASGSRPRGEASSSRARARCRAPAS